MPKKTFTKPSIILFCNKKSALKHSFEQFNSKTFYLQHISNKTDLKNALSENIVDVLIADLIINQDRYIHQDLVLECLSNPNNKLKLIFIAETGDFYNRLAAIRSGGDIFLEGPLKQNQLLEIIEPFIESAYKDPYRVLAISNSKKAINLLKNSLPKDEIVLKFVKETKHIIDILNSFTPELVILGDTLKDCTPHEMAKIVESII